MMKPNKILNLIIKYKQIKIKTKNKKNKTNQNNLV